MKHNWTIQDNTLIAPDGTRVSPYHARSSQDATRSKDTQEGRRLGW